jgi:hypothetical protein
MALIICAFGKTLSTSGDCEIAVNIFPKINVNSRNSFFMMGVFCQKLPFF